ncbi:MAG TPA: DnaB-like helicase N-terminal domain-containing protein, partial [Polyangia bacterium]|nr:DnaB-like helicase N-terminal domain-containing protein [Polyangia bacterium]
MADRDKRNGREDLARLTPTIVEGRVPPHDLDAEAAVLCAIMLDGPRVVDLLWLLPRHFYAESHARIWEAITELHAEGSPIDTVLVGTWLKDHERIAQVGGMAYLTE